jgi:hypothetical protein
MRIALSPTSSPTFVVVCVLDGSCSNSLSYTSFKVSGLILRSSIHFELILVEGDKHGSSFSFLQADIQLS